MKKALRLTAASAVLAMLVVPSAFADWRHQGETSRELHAGRTVTVEGRIRGIDRERNGFVIRLDRGEYLLFAPVQTPVRSARGRYDDRDDRYDRNHGRGRGHERGRDRVRVRDLERGDRIRATGVIENRRVVLVDSIHVIRDEDDRWDRDDRTLRGVVQSVDLSRRVVWLREERTGRVIAVDVRHAGRNDRDDLYELRRGDRIVVRGDWRRDGRFEAERLDVDRGGWW